MTELKLIAIDTSKTVFTLHGVDEQGRTVLRRELRRHQLEGFFRKLPASEIVLEACGGSHHWGRTLQGLGHTVRLIPPQYVKPFVKRGKSDRIDAEAIAEAAQRPNMPVVPVKSAEAQAEAMILSVRELLVKQRTQLINALRGLGAEFGIVAAKGTQNVEVLKKRLVTAPELPAEAREGFAKLGGAIDEVEITLAALDRELAVLHKSNEMSQRLTAVPGIGPITALSLALTIDATRFRSGRHFAAWLGLTPKQNSTGGKTRLGGISRQGNERLRQLLVMGATAVVRRAANPSNRNASTWLRGLLQRRPRKLAAVALANKMARVVWAMMTRGEAYRPQPAAG